MVTSPRISTTPPSDAQRRAELAQVHALTDHRTPQLDARAVELDRRGAWGIWQDEAAAYRAHAPGLRGWLGTLRMDAAIGAALLVDGIAKQRYHLQRPFQLDPGIVPLGPIPRDSSYPSGHSAAAAAAAAVLSELWPEHAAAYARRADEVRWARVYSGVHFPSDTVAGAQLGRRVARWFT